MNKIIEYDITGAKPYFFYRGSPSYQTFGGAILTFFSCFLLIAISLYLILCYLTDTEMYLVYSKKNDNLDLKMGLDGKILFYQVADANGNLIDDRILRTVPTLWIIDNEKNVVEQLDEVPCESEALGISFNISNYKCLKRRNSELFLEFTHQPFVNQYINIYISRCDNGTSDMNLYYRKNNNFRDYNDTISDTVHSNKTLTNSTFSHGRNAEEDNSQTGNSSGKCFTPSYIEETINKSNLFFNFYAEAINIDNNKKIPISRSYFPDQVAINSYFAYSYYYDFRRVIYKSDEGILFSNNKEFSEYYLDSTTKRSYVFPRGNQYYVDNSLGCFQFALNTAYYDRYERRYQKLYTVIASIGGFVNFITVFTDLISRLITRGYLFEKLMLSLATKSALDGFTSSKILPSYSVQFNNVLSKQKKDRRKKISFCDRMTYLYFGKSETKKYLRQCKDFIQTVLDVEMYMKLYIELSSILTKNSTSPNNQNSFGIGLNNLTLTHKSATKISGLKPLKDSSSINQTVKDSSIMNPSRISALNINSSKDDILQKNT